MSSLVPTPVTRVDGVQTTVHKKATPVTSPGKSRVAALGKPQAAKADKPKVEVLPRTIKIDGQNFGSQVSYENKRSPQRSRVTITKERQKRGAEPIYHVLAWNSKPQFMSTEQVTKYIEGTWPGEDYLASSKRRALEDYERRQAEESRLAAELEETRDRLSAAAGISREQLDRFLETLITEAEKRGFDKGYEKGEDEGFERGRRYGERYDY